MIPIKNEHQIEIMKEGGRRLALVLEGVLREVKAGVSLKELNRLAELLIENQDGSPSFKTVKGYHWATCININEGVVHGIPNEYKIRKGDVVSLDVGMFYRGFHTDMARTLSVRTQNSKFLKAGEEALKKAIEMARSGNRVGHISEAIEKEIRKAGFSPIEDLTGHGVGRNLHEEPQIPCFLKEEINRTPLLEPGITLAIEVIYAQGKPDLVLRSDGWTIQTADGKLSGLFEDTVLVTQNGPLILTPLESRLEI